MSEQITLSELIDKFRDHGRENSFSYDGFKALYEFLSETEMDNWDVIEIDSDFIEYSHALECVNDMGYPVEIDEYECDEDKEMRALDYLRKETLVIEFDDGIIIQSF